MGRIIGAVIFALTLQVIAEIAYDATSIEGFYAYQLGFIAGLIMLKEDANER